MQIDVGPRDGTGLFYGETTACLVRPTSIAADRTLGDNGIGDGGGNVATEMCLWVLEGGVWVYCVVVDRFGGQIWVTTISPTFCTQNTALTPPHK
jgi:hypothetical protein